MMWEKPVNLKIVQIEIVQFIPVVQEEKWGRGGGEGGGGRRARSKCRKHSGERRAWGGIRKANAWVVEVPRGEEEENELKIFEEIMAENFPNVMKCLNLLI